VLDDLGFEPQWAARLSGSIQIGLKPIQPSTQGVLFLGGKGAGAWGWSPTPSSIRVEYGYGYIFASPASNRTALPFIGNKRIKEGQNGYYDFKGKSNMINEVVHGVNKFIYLGSEIKIQAMDTSFLRGK